MPSSLKSKPNVNRRRNLELKLLYCIFVAGKNAQFAENVLARLKEQLRPRERPFLAIKRWHRTKGRLRLLLKRFRAGNYDKHVVALSALAEGDIDLSRCTPEELEGVPGIGPKTSRLFLLWTRPGARYAALDVHVLRWLAQQGYDVSRQTPSGRRYAEIEGYFLKEADARGVTPSALDFAIWEEGSGGDSLVTRKEKERR